MKYITVYDELYDETFQVELQDDNALPDGVPVSSTPWPNVPIKSQYRSDRHPGWDEPDAPVSNGAA
jgi:hypothetical protein